MLDALIAPDRRAELHAILRILHRQGERPLGGPESLRRDGDRAAVEEQRQGRLGVTTLEPIRGREADPVEAKRPAAPGLVEGRDELDRHSRRIAADDREADRRPRPIGHDEHVGAARIGDEALFAAQHVDVPRALRREPHPARPLEIARLEQGHGPDRFARSEARKPAAALGRAPRFLHGQGRERRRHEGRRQERPPRLLEHDHEVDPAEARPAILLGDQEPEGSLLRQGLPELGGMSVGRLRQAADLRHRTAVVQELAHGVAQKALLLGETEIHAGSVDRDRDRHGPGPNLRPSAPGRQSQPGRIVTLGAINLTGRSRFFAPIPRGPGI
jgi:hypothetical protein